MQSSVVHSMARGRDELNATKGQKCVVQLMRCRRELMTPVSELARCSSAVEAGVLDL